MAGDEGRSAALMQSITQMNDGELCARYITIVRELATAPNERLAEERHRWLKSVALAILREMRSRQRSHLTAN